eukprot:TRINITY_DN51156_c0_g1_i1.p1 TRINITY_DN51156_c0_g1~~TRINITY_DN51156_c0_g1_i1.p1  ORF type:complete len:236 (-),score=66.74 TRINITY_DN51156_c0_g1_i1:92-799(-)
MGDSNSKPSDEIAAAIDVDLADRPAVLSCDDISEVAQHCCLRLHLPFDPSEDEPKLEACARATAGLSHDLAREQIALFLQEKCQQHALPAAVEQGPPEILFDGAEAVVAEARLVLSEFSLVETLVNSCLYDEADGLPQVPAFGIQKKQAYDIADVTTFYIFACTELQISKFVSLDADQQALEQAQATMAANHVVSWEHAVSCVAAALRVKVAYAETLIDPSAQFILGIAKNSSSP